MRTDVYRKVTAEAIGTAFLLATVVGSGIMGARRDELARDAQMLVAMGCGEQCPVVPGVQRDDWPLEDPKGKPLTRVREIRDEVKQRVQRLLEQRSWAANKADPL
jgi:arsenate reductase (thioredoxin)